MKKILLLVAAAAVTAVSCNKNRVDIWVDNSPIIEFKDPRFQNALIELSSMYGDYTYSDGKKTYIQFKDMNGDGKVSEMEASRVEYLDLSGYKIRNLDELTYFTSLKVLYCQNNDVSRINVTQNTALTELNCMNNKLTDLDVSKNTSLTTLNCSDNRITRLDVSHNKYLSSLSCSGNQLEKILIYEYFSLPESFVYGSEFSDIIEFVMWD